MTPGFKDRARIHIRAQLRETSLAHRPWTRDERRVVLRGLVGRLCIAVEPIICGLFFAVLTYGMFAHHVEAALYIAPIFGLGVIAFGIYAVALLVRPIKAFFHTFSPIYSVDGYLRSRSPDDRSDPRANGYIAVLCENRDILAEWETYGTAPLLNYSRPAMVEFSVFGGVHRVDGIASGILPERHTPLGVGATKPR